MLLDLLLYKRPRARRLLALGLILFATICERLIGVIQTWLLYGLSLIPIFYLIGNTHSFT